MRDQAPPGLRPVERRVLAMQAEGLSISNIARRLQRSEGHVERMISLIAIPRKGRPQRIGPTPIERRILAMRADGFDHDEIARRFRRSARYVRQAEALAHIRHGPDQTVLDHGIALLAEAASEARQKAAHRNGPERAQPRPAREEQT